MTNIERKAHPLAKSLVNRLWATHWVQNKRSFESAKSAAIICQREMLKQYKKGLDGRIPTEHIDILKALTKEIYNLKYKK